MDCGVQISGLSSALHWQLNKAGGPQSTGRARAIGKLVGYSVRQTGQTQFTCGLPSALDEEGGPMSELQYWKGRMATCNALMESVSRVEHRPMLELLAQLDPTVVTQLSDLTVRLSDAWGEAKEMIDKYSNKSHE